VKTCFKCSVIKPLDGFYKSNGGIQGVASYCKPCDNARRKSLYLDDPDKERLRTREWKSVNPQRAKETLAKWYVENKEYANKTSAAYYLANKDKHKAAGKAWREANAAKVTESNRTKRQLDGDSIRARRRQHYAENKAAYVANARNREAGKLLATPAWADLDKIKEFYVEAARLTAETGVVHVVDHIVPLRGKRVSGLHTHHNLQVITALENKMKSNRFDGVA
jgi:5-methylcytosine-specific restriction endonuclease McrA